MSQARRQLARLDQIVLSVELLDRAAELPATVPLRSLDAIHIAAAQLTGEQLRALITYDRRMADAARELGIVVESPR